MLLKIQNIYFYFTFDVIIKAKLSLINSCTFHYYSHIYLGEGLCIDNEHIILKQELLVEMGTFLSNIVHCH